VVLSPGAPEDFVSDVSLAKPAPTSTPFK